MNPPAPVHHLYVLAGGASRRFGSDKALADVDGVPMIRGVIDRLSAALATAGVPDPTVTLVTGVTKAYEDLGHPVICDRPAEIGPLGGLAAALHHRLQLDGPGWMLLASCDLVRPSAHWVGPLRRAVTPDCNAVAYFGKRWEPMLALYHTDLLPTIESQIERGAHAMQALLNTASAERVALPDQLHAIPQANTPEQLEQQREHEEAA